MSEGAGGGSRELDALYHKHARSGRPAAPQAAPVSKERGPCDEVGANQGTSSVLAHQASERGAIVALLGSSTQQAELALVVEDRCGDARDRATTGDPLREIPVLQCREVLVVSARGNKRLPRKKPSGLCRVVARIAASFQGPAARPESFAHRDLRDDYRLTRCAADRLDAFAHNFRGQPHIRIDEEQVLTARDTRSQIALRAGGDAGHRSKGE